MDQSNDNEKHQDIVEELSALLAEKLTPIVDDECNKVPVIQGIIFFIKILLHILIRYN